MVYSRIYEKGSRRKERLKTKRMAKLQEFDKEIQALNKSLETTEKGLKDVLKVTKQLDGEFRNMRMTDAVWPVADAAVPEQVF